jgi:hypothetical protein
VNSGIQDFTGQALRPLDLLISSRNSPTSLMLHLGMPLLSLSFEASIMGAGCPGQFCFSAVFPGNVGHDIPDLPTDEGVQKWTRDVKGTQSEFCFAAARGARIGSPWSINHVSTISTMGLLLQSAPHSRSTRLQDHSGITSGREARRVYCCPEINYASFLGYPET